MNSVSATKGSWPRSAWAVFAGILANFLIAIPIDIILHAMGIYPTLGGPQMSNSLCMLAFSYRLVAAVAGGFFTARLAPRNPRKHVLLLGCIGILLSTAGAIAMWGVGPAWYTLALILISVPASVLGGRLAQDKS
jgi:MFS family permease